MKKSRFTAKNFKGLLIVFLMLISVASAALLFANTTSIEEEPVIGQFSSESIVSEDSAEMETIPEAINTPAESVWSNIDKESNIDLEDLTEVETAESILPEIAEYPAKPTLTPNELTNIVELPVEIQMMAEESFEITAIDTSNNTSFDTAIEIFVNDINRPYDVNVSEPYQHRYFYFIPNESAEVTLRSFSDGVADPMVTLYDSNHNKLTSDDDGGGGRNFLLRYPLVAGQRYYIDTFNYGSRTSNYSFTINGNFSTPSPTPTPIPENTNFDNAIRVYVNDTVNVNISASNQHRYYYFIPNESGVFTIRSFESGGSDPMASLYDSDRNKIASNDDGGGGRDFLLKYQMIAGEKYYIDALNYGSRTGQYVFTITGQSVTPTPNPENTTFDNAAYVTADTVIPVSITEINQKRYYIFVPTETGLFTIISSNSSIDPYAHLYNESREQIAYNDDDGGNRNFLISYEMKKGQSYYIAARCYSSGTGNYTFTIKSPNSQILTSTPVPTVTPIPTVTPSPILPSFDDAVLAGFNVQIPVLISFPDNIHYYYFIAPVSGTYIIESLNNGASDPYAYLYDSNRTQISSDDDSGGRPNFRITYNLTVGEKYYVGARCYGNTIGGYSFMIKTPAQPTSTPTPSPTFTPNPSFNNAIPIFLAVPAPVLVALPGQIRYYSFTAPFTGEYVFTSSLNLLTDPYAYLYNSDKQQISYNDDGAGGRNFRIVHTLRAGEKCYIGAKLYGAGIGTYTITVMPNGSIVENSIDIMSNLGNALVNITEPNKMLLYSFLAPANALSATIQTITDGLLAPLIYIYDESMQLLAVFENSIDTMEQIITYALTPGRRYYIGARCGCTNTGSYQLRVTLN